MDLDNPLCACPVVYCYRLLGASRIHRYIITIPQFFKKTKLEIEPCDTKNDYVLVGLLDGVVYAFMYFLSRVGCVLSAVGWCDDKSVICHLFMISCKNAQAPALI